MNRLRIVAHFAHRDSKYKHPVMKTAIVAYFAHSEMKRNIRLETAIDLWRASAVLPGDIRTCREKKRANAHRGKCDPVGDRDLFAFRRRYLLSGLKSR